MDWNAVAAFGALAVSVVVAWRSERRAKRVEGKADRAEVKADQANQASQDAASLANRLRADANETAHQLRDEAQRANATSDRAIELSEKANETADEALEQARTANLHRGELVRLEQVKQQLADEDRTRELSARLQCKVASGSHSGSDRSTWRFEVRNLGPALAERVTLAVKRNGEPYYAQGTEHPRLMKADERTEVEFSPHLAPFRSAIESDRYRIIATYSDAAHETAAKTWCIRFVGIGTEEHIASPEPEFIDCPDE